MPKKIIDPKPFTEASPKKNHRAALYFGIFMLIIIGILLIGAIGYTVWQNGFASLFSPKEETVSETQSEAVPTFKPIATETVAEEGRPGETEPAETKRPETKVPETKAPETKTPETKPAPLPRSVVLDPGHGYSDVGCASVFDPDFLERDLDLTLAMKVRDYLKEQNVTVFMTHENNDLPAGYDENNPYTINLEKRMSIANGKNAQLFVSIHGDSFPADESVHGTRIYYLAGDLSLHHFAELTQEAVTEALPGRKISLMPMPEDDSFYVIHHSAAPGLLIEVGFLSNQEDCDAFQSEEWLNHMAEGIGNAILACLEEINQ